MLCEYGCGIKAKYLLKFKNNNKWCCSKKHQNCKVNKVEPWNKGLTNVYSKETIEKMSRSGKLKKFSKEHRKNLSKSLKKRKLSNEHKNKISVSLTGRSFSKEHREKLKVSNKGKWLGRKHKKETKEKMRKHMLNGGAAHANSFVRNPSKPQVKLFNLCQELFPYPILNYPCIFTNKSIDIAIPTLNIAIEYDGSYYHQDEKYDKIRQEELEKQGWKFIRYLDYVPSKKQLLQDVSFLL